MSRLFVSLLVVGAAVVPTFSATSQSETRAPDPALYQALEYRFVGPYRGGRSSAVSGTPESRHTFFMGASGGLFRTDNAGESWVNISDGHFGVSTIGAIAVSPSDSQVLYVGTGQSTIRGNVALGDGIYKSTDGGENWTHVGLEDAGQIARIRIHPTDPDTAWVGVIGNPFVPNETRGVFRTRDGGANWQKVFYVDDRTGIADLALDPSNPRVLYAAAWTVERKPWTIVSGGGADGLYKSTDSGDSWERLEGGLPTGLVGKIGVTVSPADPARLWALVEAIPEVAGLYRSDDAGATWTRIESNVARRLYQRSWYYMHIFSDPRDRNTVYVLNVDIFRSRDGGATFEQLFPNHGDGHDLWINPEDPQIMILADDGGGEVSLDDGATWSTYLNQPTPEMYYVFVDNLFPYNLYGPQQDNSTIRIPSRFTGALTPYGYWQDVGGGEPGHIAFDPDDPTVIYSGNLSGEFSRVNLATGDWQEILLYPQMEFGLAPKDLKYRFHWNAPVRVSPHDPSVVYHASQYVHRSRDGGHSWETISPDLTTDDPETQETSGTPITRENDGIEIHNALLSFEESPLVHGLMWTGSDDGLVHVSRDDGASWEDVTPPGLPEHGQVRMIELSPHDADRVFVVVTNYMLGDRHPYVFRTEDGGQSWRLLTDGSNGIPEDRPVRAVREDPKRRGLLYLATERGVAVSFDDGAHWQSLQLNLPPIPVTDLRVHADDLVLATQGRGFWILDDLSPLHQIEDAVGAAGAGRPFLYQPRETVRVKLQGASGPKYRQGENPPDGVMLFYDLPAGVSDQDLILEIFGPDGDRIRRFSSLQDPDPNPANIFFADRGQIRLDTGPGMQRFVWNLRHAPVDIVDDAWIWGLTGGPRAKPGTYRARLSLGDWSQERAFEVVPDPRRETTQAEYDRQLDLELRMRDDLDRLYDAVRTLRSVREQAADVTKRLQDAGTDTTQLEAMRAALTDELRAVEETLMQPLNAADQDVENFEQKIDNQLAYVYWFVDDADHAPTEGQVQRYEDLHAELEAALARLRRALDEDLGAFEAALQAQGASSIIVPGD